MTTKNKHSRFFILLNLMPGATKESMVYDYSEGETTSLSTLYRTKPQVYAQMLKDMQLELERTTALTRKLRSKSLLVMQQLGIDTTDWNRVNAFLMDKRISGKLLFQMSNDEITALISKLEVIKRKRAQKQAEVERLTTCN